MLEHGLYHMDCMEGMKDVADNSVDMILTDPPYGTTRNDWDVKPDLPAMWEHFRRVIKPNGAILIFSQMPFTAELVISNLKWFRYEWIWDKVIPTGFLNANRMPLKVHENVEVFYGALPKYVPQFSRGERYTSKNRSPSKNYGKYALAPTINDGKRYPKDILSLHNCNKTGNVNATQKPITILEYLIKTYTDKGETVLDAFAGSGSTAIACRNTGRKFIGFEKDAEMYRKAKERIDRESAQANICDLMGGTE